MATQTSEMFSLASQICNQISSVFYFEATTDHEPSPLDVMVSEISGAATRNSRIFVHGVGREFLMLKALCMRLFHLGLSAFVVGDMTTPPISSRDLLVASAGPGGFSTVDALCQVAKSNDARVLLLTAQLGSGSCVKHADVVAYVPAQTMADDHDLGGEKKSAQLLPMGSLYEGAMFVLFEMVVYKLSVILVESPDAVRSRHTNLE